VTILRDNIRAAVERDDARKAGRIADGLRASGWRYNAIFEIFHEVTAIALPEFDALMYEADELTSRS